jgi:hypothetical protein
MLKSKSQLKCSYCSKIVKDPILLPCDDSICREHLKKSDVVKASKIKCKKCNQDFPIKDNEFRSNTNLKNLIESQSYLSEEEMSRKQGLEVSIRKFFEFYDEFNQNKTKLESDVFDHFQEIRFQIDEHRERLKEKIDDIALAMIDKLKKHEVLLSKNLKDKFSSIDDSKSIEIQLSILEDTFRNPNLLIKTIKEMQKKQEKSLKDIQLKFNEIKELKDYLKASNEFKSNLFLFNQNETSLFGSIRLNGYWLNVDSFKGQILKDEQQCSELIDLCQFSPNDKWSLLYRGTRDGFGGRDFHSKCDGHSNTLTILKAKGSDFIFGGFTTVCWDCSSRDKLFIHRS